MAGDDARREDEHDGEDPLPARIAHFRILGRLGQGGMGVVYRAEDEALRRVVALKLLPDPHGNDERRQRFLREARSAAAIAHPNVAVIHEVGEADGRVYIAMELVDGESLRTRLERERLDPATARAFGLQIARGLAAAHEKGIVHRDLKPENVMITPAGGVKLLDFGLAKAEESRTSSESERAVATTQTRVTSDKTSVLGTPEYMSPEQALGEPLDVRSDVFSFGIVLYEMLAGVRPFDGTARAVLVAIARDAPRSMRERAPAVDAQTEAVVQRCLEKRVDDRFANAAEVATALTTQHQPVLRTVSLTQVQPIPGAAPLPPRRPAVRAPAIALAVVVAALVAWSVAHRSTLAPAPASLATSPGEPAPRDAGVAITDHPAPRTANAEAAAAYASGLQHVRDGEGTYAGDDFARAATLDPAMAAAALRAVLYATNLDSHRFAELYAQALQHRAALDERDGMLLKLAEVDIADPPLPDEEGVARARAVFERFANDAEAALLYGDELGQTDVSAGRAMLERALELDPQFAGAASSLAGSYEGSDPDRALELYTRCVQITPAAGTCLRTRARMNLDRGRCDDAEADARRLTVVEPNGHRTYELLAAALAARSAPVESVRDVLDKRARLEPDDRARRRAEIEATLWTTTLAGDLAAAEKAAHALDDLSSDAIRAQDHAPATMYLLDVLEEAGETRKALDVADAYEHHVSVGSHAWLDMRIAFLRRHARRTDEATLRRTVADVARRAAGESSPGTAWTSGFFANAITLQEADEALASMPDAGPSGGTVLVQGVLLGRVYLLSGHPEAALPSLRRSAASCAILPSTLTLRASPVWWIRAHVLLGKALEETGDTAGACDAYGAALGRWKNPRPRSLSVDEARARVKALGCPRLSR